MEFKGSSAYEEKDFLENFLQRRNRVESPNNSIEKPAIYELLGDFQKGCILDLGCGDALFGKELLEAGAFYYHGVEESGGLECRHHPGDDGSIRLSESILRHYYLSISHTLFAESGSVVPEYLRGLKS